MRDVVVTDAQGRVLKVIPGSAFAAPTSRDTRSDCQRRQRRAIAADVAKALARRRAAKRPA